MKSEVESRISRSTDRQALLVSVSTACQRYATSQRHHGPAGEQLLARLRANTATAGAPEMSAVPRIQKRGEAAARALASERTEALEHRGLQVCVY